MTGFIYGKPVLQVLATLAMLIVAALTGDNHISGVETLNIANGTLTAVGVWWFPNLTGGVGKYAKFGAAFLSAVFMLATNLIAEGITISEWLQLVIAGLAAVGIIVPKAPQHPESPPIIEGPATPVE